MINAPHEIKPRRRFPRVLLSDPRRKFPLRAGAMALVAIAGASAPSSAEESAAAAAPASGWILRRADQKDLTGEIERYDGDLGRLVFHPAGEQPAVEAEVRPGLLLWRAAPDGAPRGSWAWRARLDNGDTVCGRDFAVRDGEFRLISERFGHLALDLARVRSVAAESPADVIYEGPAPDERWGAETARLEGDRLALRVGEAVVGRRIGPMPERLSLEATLVGAASHRALIWGSDTPAGIHGRGTDAYVLLQIQLIQWQLNRFTENSMFAIPRDRVLRPGTTAPVRVRLFFDGENRRATLYLGDRRAAEWTDPHPPFELGTALAFQTVFGGQFQVSNIAAARWDGRLPPDEKELSELNAEAPHLVVLRNDDRLFGAIERADGRSIVLRGAMPKALEIPSGRVALIALGPIQPTETPARGFARLRLTDGSRLTANVRRIENGEIVGEMLDGHPLRLPLDAILEILWPERGADFARVARPRSPTAAAAAVGFHEARRFRAAILT